MPDSKGFPTSKDGMYDFSSRIRPRKYGSTETYFVFSRISPSFGCGFSSSVNSKSVREGLPSGRFFNRITLFIGAIVKLRFIKLNHKTQPPKYLSYFIKE